MFRAALVACALAGGGCAAKPDQHAVNVDLRLEALEQMAERAPTTPCPVTAAVTNELQPSDPASTFHPRTVVWSYADHPITTQLDVRGDGADPLAGLQIRCATARHFTYIFFLPVAGGQACAQYDLCEPVYATFSSDGGETWSPLASLASLSGVKNFTIDPDAFPSDVHTLADDHGHALAVYNTRDGATYLFSPTLQVLKTITSGQHLTAPDYERRHYRQPLDAHLHGGILYAALRGEGAEAGTAWIERSTDYGQTWAREDAPPMLRSLWLTLDDMLYHLYATQHPSGAMAFMPALDPGRMRADLWMRRLLPDGTWDTPTRIVETAGALRGLYPHDHGALVVWADNRFLRPRACAFLPVIGCGDAEPFAGPTAVYGGIIEPLATQVRAQLLQEDASEKLY